MKKRKTLFIIDGTSCIYRAFHAIPHFTTSTGFPTNAIYGYIQTLRKILSTHNPDYIGVAFDVAGPTVRHEVYVDYKAERPPVDDALAPQFDPVRVVTEAFNIPVLELEGYEADDVLATLVRKFASPELKVVIVTSDKDMYQLVGDDVSVLDHGKDKEYGEKETVEKFGLKPALIRDMLALAGDSSDNIPGVPGVGPKTAVKLLNEYGSFDAVFAHVDNVSGKKLKENLMEHKDSALLSRELATLHDNIKIKCTLKTLEYVEPDFESLEEFLKEYEFTKLIKELIPNSGSDVKACEVQGLSELKAVIKKLIKEDMVSVAIETREGDGQGGDADVVGYCVALTSIAKTKEGHGEVFLVELSDDSLVGEIKRLLESEKVGKATDDSKALYTFAIKNDISLKALSMDTAIASYLLNPSASHKLEDVAYTARELRVDGTALKGPTGAALRSSVIASITPALNKELKAMNLLSLMNEMELPLAGVLASMEVEGILIDKACLDDLSVRMGKEVAKLQAKIFKAAGEECNLNSPKQLSVLLFEKLGLKPVKKTKTGFSTDESVLSVLARTHEVPGDIITYRQVTKLKSTYVDALLKLRDPVSGRVHTTFNQTVTATGRLSSSNPNLQNIPVRGEYGSLIRGAFVAPKGSKLLAADYSQVELRLVAHLSDDPHLVEAFINDTDVHTETAAEVFGIMPGLVTSEMRRRAKAINFGIIYGMGPHGLAKELDITIAEARDYIDAYFAHYVKVREFIDKTIADATEKGFTETLFGRRRSIPELQSPSEQTIRFGERIAVNTPVQGSAADMIKAVMIKIQERLTKEGFASKMLLQIHDELLFEVPVAELTRIKEMVVTEMEGICKLKVPLKVNVSIGDNWQKAG